MQDHTVQPPLSRHSAYILILILILILTLILHEWPLIALSSDRIHHLLQNMRLSSLGALVSFAHCARAQSPTSSYVEPTVPTGTPIPGNYNGALRPQIHYSPPIDFMVSRCTPMPKPSPA